DIDGVEIVHPRYSHERCHSVLIKCIGIGTCIAQKRYEHIMRWLSTIGHPKCDRIGEQMERRCLLHITIEVRTCLQQQLSRFKASRSNRYFERTDGSVACNPGRRETTSLPTLTRCRIDGLIDRPAIARIYYGCDRCSSRKQRV